MAASLDPLQPLAFASACPSWNHRGDRARLVDGESLPPTRLSAILHDLHASKRIEIQRHCNIKQPRLRPPEWRIARSKLGAPRMRGGAAMTAPSRSQLSLAWPAADHRFRVRVQVDRCDDE